MEFDIDFWNEGTKKDFYKFRKFLVESCRIDEKQATNFLEEIYCSVSREYGD